MRTITGLICSCFVLGWANHAWAQQQGSSILNGANPPNVTFQPIDVSKALAAPPPAVVQQKKQFSLTSLMPNIKIPDLTHFFSRNQTPPVFPGQHADAYGPFLPTTTLPPPRYPNAYNPLLPFRPSQ